MDNTLILMAFNWLFIIGFICFWNRKAIHEWFSSGKAKDWVITWFVGLPLVLGFLAIYAFFISFGI